MRGQRRFGGGVVASWASPPVVGSANARYRNAAIWPRVTWRVGQNRSARAAARDARLEQAVDVGLVGRAVVVDEVVGLDRRRQVERPDEERRHLAAGDRVSFGQ